MKQTRLDGTAGVYCLLCREWVTDKSGRSLLMDCDRFEAKEAEAFSLAQ
jgi:hypothetical protein